MSKQILCLVFAGLGILFWVCAHVTIFVSINGELYQQLVTAVAYSAVKTRVCSSHKCMSRCKVVMSHSISSQTFLSCGLRWRTAVNTGVDRKLFTDFQRILYYELYCTVGIHESIVVNNYSLEWFIVCKTLKVKR